MVEAAVFPGKVGFAHPTETRHVLGFNTSHLLEPSFGREMV
jgi:hypothetical protein